MYEIKRTPEEFVVTELMDLPPGEGEYAYYVLRKTLLSTEEAVQEVCMALGVRRKDVGYAGSKDRRAVTTQFVSVKNRKVDSMARGRWSLEFVRWGRRPLSLGFNSGNRFEIVVHGVDNFKARERFVNYFGEQRFGGINVAVGHLIVKRRFADAKDILVGEGYCADADPVAALRAVAQKTMRLFIHAYQSWVWNETVARMLAQGLESEFVPIVGFGTDLGEFEHGAIIQSILDAEGITQRDFIIRSLPLLSAEGALRAMYARADDVRVEKISQGACRVCFVLVKGSYATEFLRQSIVKTLAAPVVSRS